MKFLSRFVSFLLSLAVISTVTAFVLSGTVWNASSLQSSAESAGVSQKIADYLPTIIKDNLGLSDDETFIAKTVFTKDLVKTYLDQVLSAFAAADGSAVEINLSDVRRRIVAENLPLTASFDSFTSKPVTIIPTEQAGKLAAVKSKLDLAKVVGPIVAIALGLLVFFLAKRSRFIVLGEAAIMIAIGLGLIGLILPTIPGFISSLVGTSILAPLKDTFVAIFSSLLRAAQDGYYRFALITAGVAVVCFALHYVNRFVAKFSPQKKHA